MGTPVRLTSYRRRHLGTRNEFNPKARGFDRSYALLPGTYPPLVTRTTSLTGTTGCCNHWMWEPQLEDVQDYMPQRPIHTEDGKRADLYVASLGCTTHC